MMKDSQKAKVDYSVIYNKIDRYFKNDPVITNEKFIEILPGLFDCRDDGTTSYKNLKSLLIKNKPFLLKAIAKIKDLDNKILFLEKAAMQSDENLIYQAITHHRHPQFFRSISKTQSLEIIEAGLERLKMRKNILVYSKLLSDLLALQEKQIKEKEKKIRKEFKKPFSVEDFVNNSESNIGNENHKKILSDAIKQKKTYQLKKEFLKMTLNPDPNSDDRSIDIILPWLMAEFFPDDDKYKEKAEVIREIRYDHPKSIDYFTRHPWVFSHKQDILEIVLTNDDFKKIDRTTKIRFLESCLDKNSGNETTILAKIYQQLNTKVLVNLTQGFTSNDVDKTTKNHLEALLKQLKSKEKTVKKEAHIIHHRSLFRTGVTTQNEKYDNLSENIFGPL